MNWMKMILQFCVVSLGLFVLYLVLCVCATVRGGLSLLQMSSRSPPRSPLWHLSSVL